jgi:hypothetical protein
MNPEEINDKRLITEFKGITFSKFKKNDTLKQLLKSITSGAIEEACYWSAELICAGHFVDLWDAIFLIVSDYIHLGNPKLPIYISLRVDNFKDVVHTGYTENLLSMRNNNKIRRLFVEVIVVLCLSKKKHKVESVKIHKDEFDIVNIPSKLKAPNVEFISPYFNSGDPKELFIALNEMTYHLSNKSKNALTACYWFEWIIQFQSMCKKRKDICICARRSFAPVDEKMQMMPIWIIWEIMLDCAKKKSALIFKIVESLLKLFCTKFSAACVKKRKYLIYFGISLLVDPVDLSVSIVSDQEVVNSLASKIGKIYAQVKKNEESPDTDYLFNGLERSNLEKSIEKIETMNKMMMGKNNA